MNFTVIATIEHYTGVKTTTTTLTDYNEYVVMDYERDDGSLPEDSGYNV